MNDNTSRQSPNETPSPKRGPGRPRGSKNRADGIPSADANSVIEKAENLGNITAAQKAYRALPSMKITEAEFVEDFRKTVKNISIRPTEEQAPILIYLDKICHIPKAETIKACIDKHLREFYLETTANLLRLDAHARSGI
jgi:hypothetical protein